MKQRAALLALLCWVISMGMASIPVFGQTPALHWAKTATGPLASSQAWDLVTDPAGFVYVTGNFVGTVDLDPGAGTFMVTSPNSVYHGYVQKLDTNGNFIWAAVFPGNNMTEPLNIALDNLGNVIVTGMFLGTTDFNPGAGTSNLTSTGVDDLFVVKLNSAGVFQWVRRTGATNRICFPEMTRTDASNNIYTVGFFDGAMDFNPGAGTNNFTPVGMDDVFLQKLDANGNYVYCRTIGGGDFDLSESVALDGGGNVYVSGNFSSPTMDFDPGAGVSNLNVIGDGDYFIQKLNPSGNFLAVRRMGGPGSFMWGYTTVDATNNIVTAGSFDNTVDFDPNAGVSNLTSGTYYDGFIQKLNSSFILQWVKQLTGTGAVFTRSVTTDPSGNIYVAGDFTNTIDFDPGPGVANRTTSGQVTFILKLDPSGNFVWVAVLEGTQYSFPHSMTLDIRTNVYAGGYYYSTTDFDPQASTFFMTSNGDDQWVMKLRQSTAPLPVSELELQAVALPMRVDLDWDALSSVSLQHFELERSVDGITFTLLDTVPAHTNSHYQSIDRDVLTGERYWYRLRQVDFNGAATYSNTVEVLIPASDASVGLYPNPAEGTVTFWSNEPITTVAVVNALGQIVKEVNANNAFSVEINLEGLTAGMYWLQANQGRTGVTLRLK